MSRKQRSRDKSKSRSRSKSKSSSPSSWLALFTSCMGNRAKVQPKQTAGRNIGKDKSLQRLSFSDLSSTGMLSPEDLSISLVGSNLYVFTLAELSAVTRGFSSSNFLGEGGFGPVYKGFVDEKVKPGLKAQAVAVKLLDLEGSQGHKEWLVSIVMCLQIIINNILKLIS